MYGEGNSASTIAPPVVTMGTAALLPATGADFITTLAMTVAAGLIAWGVAYLVQAIRH